MEIKNMKVILKMDFIKLNNKKKSKIKQFIFTSIGGLTFY